jgi:uncharacterized protein (TIGR03089 family)
VTPAELLSRALRADPARPLLTFYDDATGERAELSVATYANWVAKTANLLVDGLGAGPGDLVALHLPCHWQAAVWLGACWATGTVAAPGALEADVAVVAVDEPADGVAAAAVSSPDVVGLGLGPMGLPRPDTTAPAYLTVDYDREIHGFGDRFVAVHPIMSSATALVLPDGTFAAAELGERATAAASQWDLPSGQRVLVTRPLRDLTAVLAAALVPLVDIGGAVLCRHPGNPMPARRVTEERVAAAVSSPGGTIRGVREL